MRSGAECTGQEGIELVIFKEVIILQKTIKRILSIFLTIVMVLTTFLIFDPSSLKIESEAAVSTEAGTVPNVYFYVPEAIYTKPNGTTSAATHYGAVYVDGTINSSNAISLNTGEQKYGNIYFYYENASSVKISYSVIASNTTSSNHKITYASSSSATSGTALYSTGYSSTAAISSSTNKVQQYIINSQFYLSGTETGAYLKWTASFVDKSDNSTKTATAYTYIYL